MTQTAGVNPKDALGMAKSPLRLVPPALELFAAEAFRDGAEKYGPYNWRQTNVSTGSYYEAAKRHLDSWWDGEDIDPKSNVHHLAHAAACIAILLDGMAGGFVVDDRPPPGPAAEIIQNNTRAVGS